MSLREAFRSSNSVQAVLAALVGAAIAAASMTLTGTLDVTGVITNESFQTFPGGAGFRLGSDAADPAIVHGTGSPDGATTRARGSLFLRTDTAQLWQNVDGSTDWTEVGAGAAAATPSVSITDTTAIATTNLSTVGTIDWYFPAPSLTYPTQTATDTVHSKFSGGWILDSFRWRPAAGTLYSAAPGPAFSSTASDDILGLALSTSTVYGVSAAFGDVQAEGFGYTFRVPATTTSRVLRIYQRTTECSNNTGARFLSVRLRDAGTTSSLGPSSGSSSPVPNRVYVITFNSSTDDELIVTFTFKNTGAYVGTCTMSISGATLSAT